VNVSYMCLQTVSKRRSSMVAMGALKILNLIMNTFDVNFEFGH
jgi:hypothetical protein